ncbi:flagellar motor switch protein FliM [Novosphingobium panipatense]|uniref:Flagellar motor switch protein FliM n=1 Tax=Novosphingobium panipatense TaxID=428991 RepID=A0ABY1QQW8_9SPHN|nr:MULTISPECIES: flagellar motor switch protein FliM [Novosphingobium]SMP76118.1 flagellar motor switch protein FliM [Novosphingobium panipatense]
MSMDREDPSRPETVRLAAVDGEALPRRGLKAVLESNVISHERLPMLEVVCERMVRTFATSMRNLTSDAIEVNLEAITSVRFGDFMDHVALPAMFGVFQVKPWESYGVVTVDAGLIYGIVDALLGGRGGSRALPPEGRTFTTIESSLVSRVVQMALDELAAAFEEIASVAMGLERMELSPRFAAIAEPSNAAAVATYRVSMEGRGGVFSILLPYATLEPVRDKLLQRFMGEKLGRDRIWSQHMASELYNTEVTVDVVLGEKMMSLRDVRDLKVGHTIALSHSPEDPLHLQCGGVPLGRAHIGQRSSNIAIRMATDIAKGYSK